MKRLYGLLAVLAVSGMTSMLYAGVYKSVLLKRVDGTTMGIGFENGVEVALHDGRYIWTSDKGSIGIPASDIQNWSFTKSDVTTDWSGVDDVSGSNTESVTIVGNEIVISNLRAGSSVRLTDLAGHILENIADIDECVISLENRPSGIYVLSVNDRSLKIVKR